MFPKKKHKFSSKECTLPYFSSKDGRFLPTKNWQAKSMGSKNAIHPSYHSPASAMTRINAFNSTTSSCDAVVRWPSLRRWGGFLLGCGENKKKHGGNGNDGLVTKVLGGFILGSKNPPKKNKSTNHLVMSWHRCNSYPKLLWTCDFQGYSFREWLEMTPKKCCWNPQCQTKIWDVQWLKRGVETQMLHIPNFTMGFNWFHMPNKNF